MTRTHASIVEHCREGSKAGHNTNTDLSKAYESVSIELIAKTMYANGTPSAFVKTYFQMCLERKIVFVAPGIPATKSIALKKGLPQGCPTSPVVLTIVVDFFLRGLVGKWIREEK